MGDEDSKSTRSDYPRRARYMPGLLMMSPVGVVVIAAGWDDARIVTTLLGLAGTIGLPFVLESFVRQAGLRYDVDKLPGSNGRWATTDMLWPEPEESEVAARNAANRGVVEAVVGRALPSTPPADAAQTTTVEATLDEAVAELRSRTRDKEKFPLLAEENAEYGMWRNLLGVRMYGFVIALVAMLVAAVFIGVSLADAFTSSTAELVVGWLVTVAIAAFWSFIPSERRVIQAAQRYALALLDAARVLGHES